MQGLWRRTRLETPARTDTTTRVSWMQAGALHVDVRLPADVDAIDGLRALSALDAAGLERLAHVEGFAGVTAIVEGTCTWTRRIDYRGALDGADVGTLRWEVPATTLIETGVHADYVEHWSRETPERAHGRAFAAASGQRLYLCRTATRFALGRADPAALRVAEPFGTRLAAALARADRSALATLFDMEFSTGRIEAGHGIVERSTNPARRGDHAFGPDALDPGARTVALSTRSFDGETVTMAFTPLDHASA